MKPEMINANIIGTIRAIEREASDSRVMASEAWEYGTTIARKKISKDKETEYAKIVENSEQLEAACRIVMGAIIQRTKHDSVIEPVDNAGSPVEHISHGWELT